MSVPSELNLTAGPLLRSMLGKNFDLTSSSQNNRELQAFIYLLADDYSVQYSNGYFRREFGQADGSKHCYTLMRGRNTPCDSCPAQKAIKQNKAQVWIWEDSKRGKLYEVHDYPYLSESEAMVLGLGIVIKEDQKEKKPDRGPQCYREFLSICSHCKNINNDQGEWEEIESYFTKRYEILFSHGICPECIQKYYKTVFKSEKK